MSWFRVEDRKPEDGQTVLGRWTGLLSNQQPTFESVTFHAWDAEDGPEAWHNAWGEQTDAPEHWLPLDALPALLPPHAKGVCENGRSVEGPEQGNSVD